MGVNISQELISFLSTVIAGVFWGIFYDFFHVLSKFFKRKLFLSFFDILFTVFAFIITIFIFYSYSSYSLRLFLFLGLFLGGILYFLILSKPVRCILGYFFKNILKLFHFIFKILLTTVRFLYKILLVHFLNFAKKILHIKCKNTLWFYRGFKYEKIFT